MNQLTKIIIFFLCFLHNQYFETSKAVSQSHYRSPSKTIQKKRIRNKKKRTKKKQKKKRRSFIAQKRPHKVERERQSNITQKTLKNSDHEKKEEKLTQKSDLKEVYQEKNETYIINAFTSTNQKLEHLKNTLFQQINHNKIKVSDEEEKKEEQDSQIDLKNIDNLTIPQELLIYINNPKIILQKLNSYEDLGYIYIASILFDNLINTEKKLNFIKKTPTIKLIKEITNDLEQIIVFLKNRKENIENAKCQIEQIVHFIILYTYPINLHTKENEITNEEFITTMEKIKPLVSDINKNTQEVNAIYTFSQNILKLKSINKENIYNIIKSYSFQCDSNIEISHKKAIESLSESLELIAKNILKIVELKTSQETQEKPKQDAYTSETKKSADYPEVETKASQETQEKPKQDVPTSETKKSADYPEAETKTSQETQEKPKPDVSTSETKKSDSSISTKEQALIPYKDQSIKKLIYPEYQGIASEATQRFAEYQKKRAIEKVPQSISSEALSDIAKSYTEPYHSAEYKTSLPLARNKDYEKPKKFESTSSLIPYGNKELFNIRMEQHKDFIQSQKSKPKKISRFVPPKAISDSSIDTYHNIVKSQSKVDHEKAKKLESTSALIPYGNKELFNIQMEQHKDFIQSQKRKPKISRLVPPKAISDSSIDPSNPQPKVDDDEITLSLLSNEQKYEPSQITKKAIETAQPELENLLESRKSLSLSGTPNTNLEQIKSRGKLPKSIKIKDEPNLNQKQPDYTLSRYNQPIVLPRTKSTKKIKPPTTFKENLIPHIQEYNRFEMKPLQEPLNLKAISNQSQQEQVKFKEKEAHEKQEISNLRQSHSIELKKKEISFPKKDAPINHDKKNMIAILETLEAFLPFCKEEKCQHILETTKLVKQLLKTYDDVKNINYKSLIEKEVNSSTLKSDIISTLEKEQTNVLDSILILSEDEPLLEIAINSILESNQGENIFNKSFFKPLLTLNIINQEDAETIANEMTLNDFTLVIPDIYQQQIDTIKNKINANLTIEQFISVAHRALIICNTLNALQKSLNQLSLSKRYIDVTTERTRG